MQRRKLRKRKTGERERIGIAFLYSTGLWTMKELGETFGVSTGRVSQIVNDTYGEMDEIVRVVQGLDKLN